MAERRAVGHDTLMNGLGLLPGYFEELEAQERFSGADEEAGERYEDLWRDRPNYAVTTTADFLPQFIDKPANFAPGQGCRYCNVGYVLLGLVVERLSGPNYRDYVREHIFDKAGMTHSAFLHQGEVNEQAAEGSDPQRDGAGRITGWKKNI